MTARAGRRRAALATRRGPFMHLAGGMVLLSPRALVAPLLAERARELDILGKGEEVPRSRLLARAGNAFKRAVEAGENQRAAELRMLVLGLGGKPRPLPY
ncbi:hypothetical protein HYS54_03820 [Candidatus Micrarchaeota archaeon]|nr:hypothetical protein [Candidatus Micrarchaeota archaeon]